MTATAPAGADLLIVNATLLPLGGERRVQSQAAVAIAGGRIAATGDGADLRARYAPVRTLDARGGIVMPGLVNVHNHTPLMITRGMIEDLGHAPMYTPGIPQGHRLSAEEAYLLARLGLYEMLRCGSTTVVDYYRYPEACAQAASELGLRAVIGGRIHDADPEALAQGRYEHATQIGAASIAENADLIERWDGRGRIRCDWAPHAPDTCSADLLREVARLAAGRPGNLHTHLAQSPGEVAQVRARDGRTPAELLEECGLLDARLIAAHCIHLDDADVARAGRAGITVAHSPIGNAKSGRIAPILALARAGARIALCTDTMSGDLFEAMRWAVAMQRVREHGSEPDAWTALAWATQAGADALGWGSEIGALVSGRAADIVVLDPASPVAAPVIDGAGIVVYSANGLAVRHALVAGEPVLADGAPTRADGAEIVAQAQAVAARLWARA